MKKQITVVFLAIMLTSCEPAPVDKPVSDRIAGADLFHVHEHGRNGTITAIEIKIP